jgi:hypothetical protein
MAKLVVIRAEERLRWHHAETETTFIYRRPTPSKLREIQAEHTVRGEVDEYGSGMALCEYAILDWEGPIDHTGEPVVYDKSILPFVPESVLALFLLQLYASTPEVELKN